MDILITTVNDWWWVWLITAVRFYGVILVCPLFASNYFSHFLKIILALLFGSIVSPYFIKTNLSTGVLIKLIYLGKELCFGAVLGYFLGFPFWLIEACGNLIDLQRGEQFGAIINKLTNNLDSTFGRFLLQGFLTYFAGANGFLFFCQIVFKSYKFLPIDHFLPNSSNWADSSIEVFTAYCYWVVVLSLPVLVLLLIIDLVMGLIGAFLPGLNITVLSMPIKSMIASGMMVLYLAVLYHHTLLNFITQVRKVL